MVKVYISKVIFSPILGNFPEISSMNPAMVSDSPLCSSNFSSLVSSNTLQKSLIVILPSKI